MSGESNAGGTGTGAGAGAGAGEAGGAGGGQPAGGAPAGGAPPITVAQIPDEALKERLDRHGRKVLEQTLGVKTPEEAKALKDRLAAYEKAEQERQQAAMSEIEKATKAAQDADARAKQLEQELATERRNAKIAAALHAKGVKNLDYGRFLLDRDTAGQEEPNYEEALGKALGDPLTRTALGIAEQPGGNGQQPVTKVVPITTTPTGDGAPKPPVAGGTDDSGPKSANKMSAEEWNAFKRSNGIF